MISKAKCSCEKGVVSNIQKNNCLYREVEAARIWVGYTNFEQERWYLNSQSRYEQAVIS